ncbi:MAG: hypothetical protein IT306_19500 [Chloroflexi bacterium]|nr:hypothetical protein [Chloroflexota bacterium]
MNPESPSFGARLRAGLARSLAALGGGSRRLESWTARSTRTVVLGAIALTVLAAVGLGLAFEGRHALAWFGGHDRPPHARLAPPNRFEGKPEGGFVGKPHAKPEAPRPAGPGGPGGPGRPGGPPPPPAPPAPPAP